MFTTIVALGTIATQLIIVILIVGIILKAPFIPRVAKHTPIILRIVFVGAVIGSLIYEYGFGYAPCLLCWYQRMAIFPIAILAFTGDIRSNSLLRKQILIIAILGFLVAMLHIYIDIFPTGLDLCGSNGPSCLARYIYEFGYITIPVMSATTLLFGIVLSYISKLHPQK